MERSYGGIADRAFVPEQFEPQLRLVGLLRSPAKLRNELVVRASAASFANVGGHGYAGAQQLLAEDSHFLALPGKLGEKPDDARSKSLRPIPKRGG